VKKAAKLMIWRNVHGSWHLTLWIPFHGQWELTSHIKKPMFDRKARAIIKALPGVVVEEVDSEKA